MDLVVFPPRTLEILKRAYNQLIRGQKLDPIEIQSFTKDGKKVWGKATTTLIRLHNEILIQVIAQDITEQKFSKE